MLYYFIFLSVSSYIFYYKDINNFISYKYGRLVSLNELVSSRYDLSKKKLTQAENSKELLNIIYQQILIKLTCLKMLFEYFYIYLVEKYNEKFHTKVVKINKNKYHLNYFVNNKKYIMVLTPMRGPAPILKIFDENQIDRTHEILQYVGIHYDFHNIKFTPNFFKYKSLHFIMANGDIKSFHNNQHIVI